MKMPDDFDPAVDFGLEGDDTHRHVEFQELETIFVGSMPETVAVQAALNGNGIQAYIADQQMKFIDPFITGMNPLDVRLQVPKGVADEAREVIVGLRSGAVAEETPEEAAADADSSEDPATRMLQLERLAHRVRWVAIATLFMPLIAPYSLYLSVDYVLKTTGMETKPLRHALTIGVIWFVLIWSVLAVAVFASLLSPN